MQRDE
jgi:pyruvate kinase